MRILTTLLLATLPTMANAQQNPYLQLMNAAWAHAEAHGVKVRPVLSPDDASILNKSIPIAELHAAGFRIIPWNPNDAETIRTEIRMGVDGLITDRPDILQQVLGEERAAATTSTQRDYLRDFDVSAHRGGRGLRPENTLPSFESGLDHLVTTLETDTGVTTDHVSLIWHDQYLNPDHCRRADGAPYTLANRVYTRDISMADAAKTFVCDKLNPKFPDQRNDLALSPVSVAFAAKEGMPSPYSPTNAEQLFRFTRFYAEFYRTGPGASSPHAAERAHSGDTVRFNLETKILPDHVPTPAHLPPGITPDMLQNHTVGPQLFVDTLVGAIKAEGMTDRSEIQSFDFRTLLLVEEQHPEIPTYYLTENPALFSTDFVPTPLRQLPTKP